jgi:hypothetical protein
MRDLKVDKLADEFGQYLILIECRCGHTRRCHPSTLAAIAGWDARLVDIVKRLRCSKFDHMADFISSPTFKLFKLHGSITWARRILTRIGAGINTNDPLKVAYQVIQQTSLDISAEYEVNNSPSQPPVFHHHYAQYPAIAIPVEKKADFECPTEHLGMLKTLIPKTTRILTIGWRATEDHFLQLLRTLLPTAGVDVVACSGDKANADQTLNRLRGVSITGNFVALTSGFTNMIARAEIVDFLKGL